MRFLISLLINGLIIYAGAAIFSGIHVTGYGEAVIAALLLGIVNFFIRPLIVNSHDSHHDPDARFVFARHQRCHGASGGWAARRLQRGRLDLGDSPLGSPGYW
jgi:hypothetical protein